MPVFTVRPTVRLEAYQVTREALDNPADWPEWLAPFPSQIDPATAPAQRQVWISEHPRAALKDRAFLCKLPLDMDAGPYPLGTWIVRSKRGEFQRCESDVFPRAYEPA